MCMLIVVSLYDALPWSPGVPPRFSGFFRKFNPNGISYCYFMCPSLHVCNSNNKVIGYIPNSNSLFYGCEVN